MTTEQLDEIEKLADAATPGLWVAEKNAALITAMREYALPMVKALREARQERDTALKDAETQGAMHHRYYWSLMACEEARAFDKDDHQKVLVTLTKERDEARAEVERLRDVMRQVHALASEAIVGTAVGAYLRMTEIHKITKGMVE